MELVQQYETIIDSIMSNSYAVCDDFLDVNEIQLLIDSSKSRYDQGEFKLARIGKLGEVTAAAEIRGDEILWLENESTDIGERMLLDKTQTFVDYLNATCYLGIKNSEIHFAKYDVGTFYRRHRDTFQTQKGRILSIIYYLNQNWIPANGGQLVIYTQVDGIETPIIIDPIAGRMVCFESEKLEHEVLETFALRHSVTGWLLNI